ncbi:MAG: ArsR/SmtB family transcription factor [Candidatus Bipolaricaulia bacterium]
MDEIYTYFFKSLAHRSRLKLLKLLADNEEMSVTDLTQLMDIEQSSVSRHLNILRRQGIVKVRVDGQMRYYSLNLDKIREILDKFIKSLKTAWQR